MFLARWITDCSDRCYCFAEDEVLAGPPFGGRGCNYKASKPVWLKKFPLGNQARELPPHPPPNSLFIMNLCSHLDSSRLASSQLTIFRANYLGLTRINDKGTGQRRKNDINCDEPLFCASEDIRINLKT